MAGQERHMEGNEEQRRKAAREARERGNLPSEESATLGASKQRSESDRGDTHQEKLDERTEGKVASGRAAETDARPGSRDQDSDDRPKR